MNLLEVIFALANRSSGERRRCLVAWGVEPALWQHIQALFTQEGPFTQESAITILDYVYKGKKPTPSTAFTDEEVDRIVQEIGQEADAPHTEN